jgi:dipeptidyl aminopeptidase/acylaminoacyl peptidase
VKARVPALTAPLVAVLLVLSVGFGGDTAGPVVAARPAPVLAGAHNDTSTPFNFVSVPALRAHRFDGRDLRLERVLLRTLALTRYAVSYRSGDLRITGVLDAPTRAGRHPLVVLAHGWTDPADYTSGSMLERERSLLAANGFAALQIDYRNHAGSTREAGGTVARPLGYPEDLVNAVRAVERARLPFVDTDRVGLFGRSMGGGVVLNALAARPGLADAAFLYAPVSSSAADNFERWVRDDPVLAARVEAVYGTPASRPRLWREAGSRGYLDRVDVPVLIAHGTADATCPVAWSRATAAALRAGGGDVELVEYAGEGHRFDRAWPAMMHRAVAFLHAHLG